MPGFLLALQTRSRAEAARARVQEQALRQWGLTGQWRRVDFLRGLPARWDSPLPGRGLRARVDLRLRGWAVLWVLYLLPFPPEVGWAQRNPAWGQAAIAPACAAEGRRAGSR